MNLTPLVKLVVFCVCGNAVLSIGHAQPRSIPRTAALASAGRSSPTDVGIMSGPVLGMVSSRDNTEIQGIVGVPGAALLDVRVSLPENVGRIYLAPAHRWSLVDKADGSGMAFLSLDSEAPASLLDIQSSIVSPDLVAFSPDGNRAAIYSRIQHRLQVVAIEGRSARVDREVPIAQVTSSKIRLVAVDDSAQVPIVVTDSGTTFVLRGQFMSDIAVQGQDISDMSFLPGGTVLFLAGKGGVVTAVDSLAEVPSIRVVSVGLGATGDHFFLQGLRDGQTLIVASSESKTAWRFDVNARTTESIELPEAAVHLQRLRSGNAFLFSNEPDAPAWVLLADEPVMRTVFIARRSNREDAARGRRDAR